MNDRPTTQVSVKYTDKDTAIVAGYGVVFGGADLYGEAFTPETDFRLGYVPEIDVYYDHTLEEVKHRLGSLTKDAIKIDDVGLWIEAQLNRHADYVDAVLELAERGVLGWSSGSIGHLVQRDGKTIKQWPIVEFSLTPTPAEPRTVGVERVKQLSDLPKDETAEAAGATADGHQANDDIQIESIVTLEGSTMAEEAKTIKVEESTQPAAEYAVKSDVDNLNTKLDQLLNFMQSEPAIRKAGYYTEDGGTQDKDTKSFGDWLLAVRRNDVKRLHGVYNSIKDMTEGIGGQGGYLVPPDYANTLLQMAADQSQITNRVTTVPVGTDRGFYPALDQFNAPTAGAGNTALAGGITAATTAEGGTLTETQATFEDIEWVVNKVGGYTEVSNELIQDSPQSIETLLSSLFAISIAARNERNILRGTGAGQPLGILNAGSAVSVTVDTNNVFAYADAAEMLSRFKRYSGNPVWLIHPGIWPDIASFEVGTGGAVWQANVPAGQPMSLLGYPILQSEHLPQDDNAGCVILADLSAYLFFVRSTLEIAFSEHAAFTTDKGTWRFTQRNDGQPWLKSAVTLADPQGSFTVSPFVYLTD